MGPRENYEDAVLSKALGLSLSDTAKGDASLVYLGDLAQELKNEGSPAALSELTVERALMERLSNPPATTSQWPLYYLLGCYARTRDLLVTEHELQTTLNLVKQLIVSYSSLVLFLDMFPQSEAARARGALQLLDSLEAATRQSQAFDCGGGGRPDRALEGSPTPMPPDFMDELCVHLEAQDQVDSWRSALETMALEIIQRASKLTILGDAGALVALTQAMVCGSRAVSTAVTLLSSWDAGKTRRGRELESKSILGSLLAISGIPDIFNPESRRVPDIVEECFPEGSHQRSMDVRNAVLGLQAAANQHHRALHGLFMALLRSRECKTAVLDWLALALAANQERAKMHLDPSVASSDGFMINLSAVLLLMCEPFMGANSGKAWARLDPAYVSDPGARASLDPDETRLAATGAELTSWVDGWAAGVGRGTAQPAGSAAIPVAGDGGGPKPTAAVAPVPVAPTPYHFITDIFFMTARCLGIGYAKSIDNLKSFGRRLQSYEDAVATLEAQLQRFPDHLLSRARLGQYRRMVRQIKGADGAYQAALLNPPVISDVLTFYRLLTAFMLRVADPRVGAGQPYQLPLPDEPPMEFRQLPEAWIENLAEVLVMAAHMPGRFIQASAVEDSIVFITICLSSPKYVKNPYLRGQLVAVLHQLTPIDEEDAGRPSFSRQRGRASSVQTETAALFQAHELVIHNMVKSLIELYVDIEMTDRHNTFYEKFTVRYQIGEIMAYLWQLPQHHRAWRHVATAEPYTYVRFINMMINDSQLLLQEALETLPRVRDIELQMEDSAVWSARPPAERAELEESLHTDHGRLKSDFYLASVYVNTMLYTAKDSVVGSKFFDPQVRDRVARILNFFLKYLTVPNERKKLRVKDPEALHWNPKLLVLELGQLHVALCRRNEAEWVAANVADTDYLGTHPEILEHLIGILRHLGSMAPDELADLHRLAAEVTAARARVEEEEAAFEDIPAEYEDPLMGTLMHDPVRLPSGNVVDRATIMQQLLTDQRDPFSRAPMTDSDLEPLPELRGAIQDWVAEQRRNMAERRDGGLGGQKNAADSMES